ncbi:hypothetical protein [Streptomyces sp. NPDC058964]|uniref:hypothetical protein n=1 Tax=Streptomyces sp. NPDC058964 TaxID=3346681 RepID=UPI003681CFBA
MQFRLTVLARWKLPAHAWALGIALLTVALSVGQAVGPLVSGLLYDSSGGIAKGLWLDSLAPCTSRLCGSDDALRTRAR